MVWSNKKAAMHPPSRCTIFTAHARKMEWIVLKTLHPKKHPFFIGLRQFSHENRDTLVKQVQSITRKRKSEKHAKWSTNWSNLSGRCYHIHFFSDIRSLVIVWIWIEYLVMSFSSNISILCNSPLKVNPLFFRLQICSMCFSSVTFSEETSNIRT